ncbi:MAG: hypothetical protein ACREAJ_00035 [Nitrosopumilaceae archaeon]
MQVKPLRKIAIILTIILIVMIIWVNQEFFSNLGLTNDEKTESGKSSSIPSNRYVKEYSLPAETWPNGIIVDQIGEVWVAGSKIHKLFKFLPETEEFVSSFQISNQSNDKLSDSELMVWTIVEDKNGIFWFSQLGPNPIWRFDPITKKFDAYQTKTSSFQMKSDKNTGDVWFTTLTANTVGIIQQINDNKDIPEYKITEFPLDSDGIPSGIFLEDEYVWITLINDSMLTKYLPVKDDKGFIINITKILELPVTKENLVSSPTDMIIFNDSSIWVPEHGTSFITKFKDFQSVIKFPTSQNEFHATSLPFWLKGTKDDKGFWFNEHTGNKIGFFDIEKMELIEYNIPSRPYNGYIVYPLNIATDPTNDDLLWFSEWNTNKIGKIDKSISLPFEIVPNKGENIVFQDDDKSFSAKIAVNLIKNKNEFYEENTHNIVFLNASSSLELNGGLGNMTVTFSTDHLYLIELNEERIDILVQNIPINKNYTLSISATDGIVTKSIFFELINKSINTLTRTL